MHLQKLSVGSTGIDSLMAWQKTTVARRKAAGLEPLHEHVTRMFPKAKDEIVNGGSIYWVIKGMIICRNGIVDLRRVTRSDGVKACSILMNPELIPVVPQPRRAFQGWRYLKPEDAPQDLADIGGAAELPEELRNTLIEIGAW